MVTILLMGVASGEWLPLLFFLLGIGAVVQIVDMGIQFFKKWRKKRQMQLENYLLNDSLAEDVNNDPFNNFSAN